MDQATVGFRISDWDTPLRVNPNRSPGRYNHAGSPATQYFGLHPLTPWAEYMRYHGLRDAEELANRRLSIWAVRLDVADAPSITFENASTFGLEPWDLVSADHSACRELADRLRNDSTGPQTVVVPSAALPGTRNVVVLGERAPIPYLWTPIDEVDLPVSIVAAAAQPPLDLIPFVRHGDEAHREFEAWARGERYAFGDVLL